jgi:hypothetical protein
VDSNKTLSAYTHHWIASADAWTSVLQCLYHLSLRKLKILELLEQTRWHRFLRVRRVASNKKHQLTVSVSSLIAETNSIVTALQREPQSVLACGSAFSPNRKFVEVVLKSLSFVAFWLFFIPQAQLLRSPAHMCCLWFVAKTCLNRGSVPKSTVHNGVQAQRLSKHSSNGMAPASQKVEALAKEWDTRTSKLALGIRWGWKIHLWSWEWWDNLVFFWSFCAQSFSNLRFDDIAPTRLMAAGTDDMAGGGSKGTTSS